MAETDGGSGESPDLAARIDEIEQTMQGVRTALEHERADHAETRKKLSAWKGLDPEDVRSRLDRIGDLEAAAADKLDGSGLDEVVKQKVQPVKRELKRTSDERDELRERVKQLEAERTQRKLRDDVTAAFSVNGTDLIRPEAREDALLLAERIFEVQDDGQTVTRDGVGWTPGQSPQEWISELLETGRRPHWLPGSTGGGARGAGPSSPNKGPNPWSKDNWSLTEQGRYVKEHGLDAATRAAQAAGSRIGATRPTG